MGYIAITKDLYRNQEARSLVHWYLKTQLKGERVFVEKADNVIIEHWEGGEIPDGEFGLLITRILPGERGRPMVVAITVE